MSFATTEDWLNKEKAILHIADMDGDGQPDLPEIAEALQTAFEEMNGWLASRYEVVPDKARPTLLMHQVKMASYHLSGTSQSRTDQIESFYKSAIDYLKSVSSGRADLPGTDKGGDLDGGSGGVQMVAPDRVFSRDTLKDF